MSIPNGGPFHEWSGKNDAEDKASRLESEVASLKARLARLVASRAALDCRYAGEDIADISGSHCPLDKPCARCELEKGLAEADRARTLPSAAGDPDRMKSCPTCKGTTGETIWHRCSNDEQVRPYSSLLCSRCRRIEPAGDFNALEAMRSPNTPSAAGRLAEALERIGTVRCRLAPPCPERSDSLLCVTCIAREALRAERAGGGEGA